MIYKKVMASDNGVDAIARLKEELQSNYTKFFKETFKDREFQSKWERLEKIRHKVAHNNLFTQSDNTAATELSAALVSIIEDADQKIDAVVFSMDEQESILDSFVQSYPVSNGQYSSISEDELLRELEQQEELSEVHRGYVGLSRFVKFHLGDKGFDYKNSYDVVESLFAKCIVEVYEVAASFGQPVRAIRRTSNTIPNSGDISKTIAQL